MQTYTKLEVDAVLAMFSAFDIGIEVENGKPSEPMTIRAKVYKWSDGTYHDRQQEKNHVQG